MLSPVILNEIAIELDDLAHVASWVAMHRDGLSHVVDERSHEPS
jgi:hypothetical protein